SAARQAAQGGHGRDDLAGIVVGTAAALLPADPGGSLAPGRVLCGMGAVSRLGEHLAGHRSDDMTTTTLHPLAADYLDRLERAARRLPRGERRELVEEISAHLSE